MASSVKCLNLQFGKYVLYVRNGLVGLVSQYQEHFNEIP